MRRQLQIRDGMARCEWRGIGSPIAPDVVWIFIDVTDRPDALLGMLYDALTDVFSPAPPPPKVLSYNEFILLFTGPERKALRTLAQTNEDAADILDLLRTAPVIPMAAQRTANLLQQLVGLGILTAQRRIAILNTP